MPHKELKTAFVFAGGGSLGSIQVGMLRALIDSGLTADMVVGSSVGAINAAYFAGSPNADGVERLAGIWVGLKRSDIFPVSWRSMAAFLIRRDFLIPSDGVVRLVDKHLPYTMLEDAQLPVHVIATDLLSGGPVVLSSGSAVLALTASTAIPAAFAPVMHNNQFLADGALSCNTPIKVAIEQGADRVIVLPTGYACALPHPPRGAIASALHALTLLIARQLLHELADLAPHIQYHVVPPLCPLHCAPYDFSKTGELIEHAAASTRAWLAEGGLEQCTIPHQMYTHKHP